MYLDYLRRPSDMGEGEPKPILFLLHGYGSNMQDLFSFAPDIPQQYEVISFNAPYKTPYGGNAWFEINLVDPHRLSNAEEAKESMRKIRADIKEHCDLWNCPYDLVNILGFSQGGVLCYALSLQEPDKYDKVLCLSCFPSKDMIGDLSQETNFDQLHFYISHGYEDAVIPYDFGLQGKKLMEQLGIKYEFKGYHEGHGINPENFRDIMAFLK